MEQSSMVFQKDGKNYLQLDCENAKELSMKLGEKHIHLQKMGKMDSGASVLHSSELCTDLCGRTGGSAS